MASQFFDQIVYQLQLLKQGLNLGRINGLAYFDGRARILDPYICAPDCYGYPPPISIRLQRVMSFQVVLCPTEVYEEEQRILGRWPQRVHPPHVLAPSLCRPGVVVGWPPQEELIELPSPPLGCARSQSQYEVIGPGTTMTALEGKVFLDNFFLPYEKQARGGGQGGRLVYKCECRDCTMLCRLVPVGSIGLVVQYQAEVKSLFSKHTNHPAEEYQQVLEPVQGPGGKAKGFRPLTAAVKQFINQAVVAQPHITPDAISLLLVTNPSFANLPFLTNQHRRADTRSKVRAYRDHGKKVAKLADPASSLSDIQAFETDHQLVVPHAFTNTGPIPTWVDFEAFYTYYRDAFDLTHAEKWKDRFQLITLPSPSDEAFRAVLGRDLSAQEVLRVARSVVFTSLPDLYNMLMWTEMFPLELRVVHCDGVYGLVCHNTQAVITISTSDVGWRPAQEATTRSPRPFGHVLCPKGETTISVITLYLCLKEAAAALFRLDKVDFNFSTAICDHSDALASGLCQLGGPDTDVGMCYPHVSRLFTKPKWVKQYMNNKDYASRAKSDVRLLHRSRSREQFEACFALVMNQWRLDDEGKLADHFTAFYGPSTKWGTWYYCALGMAGLIPNNNPAETYNRRTKGDDETPGPIALKTSVSVFLNREAPALLSRDYLVGAGVSFKYPVGYSKHMIATVALAAPTVDFRKSGEVYWVNHPRLYGNPITNDRINSYMNILGGDISAYTEIREIERATFQLCRVRVLPDGTTLFPSEPCAVCDCKHYFMDLQCTGTVIVEDMLKMKLHPISSSFIAGSEAGGGTATDAQVYNLPGGFAFLEREQLFSYFDKLTSNQVMGVARHRGLRLPLYQSSLTGSLHFAAMIGLILEARGLPSTLIATPTPVVSRGAAAARITRVRGTNAATSTATTTPASTRTAAGGGTNIATTPTRELSRGAAAARITRTRGTNAATSTATTTPASTRTAAGGGTNIATTASSPTVLR
jgi:hypothetical protein